MNEPGQEISRSNCCVRFFKSTAAILNVDDKASVPMTISSFIAALAACSFDLLAFIGGCPGESAKLPCMVIGVLLSLFPQIGIFSSAYNFGKFVYRRANAENGVGKFLGMMLSLAGFILSAGFALACQIALVVLNDREDCEGSLSIAFMSTYISILMLGAVVLANALCGAITGYMIERKNAPDNQRLLSEDMQPKYGMDI